VAVKVQYPGVDGAITSDLKNADMLGVILKQGFGGLDPTEMVDEIKIRLTEEVDYELEARNQREFYDYYAGHPYIRIPEIVPAYCTKRVLTSQLVDGFGWADLLKRPQVERDHAGEVIFRFVFRSLYRMGAFNGDPHPGNYIFHDDGTVTFLDFGLVKHFTSDELDTFASMVEAAAVKHNPHLFREILERAGMLQADAPVDTDEVGEYFSLFYDTVARDEQMTWTREYANTIVRHTFDRARRTKRLRQLSSHRLRALAICRCWPGFDDRRGRSCLVSVSLLSLRYARLSQTGGHGDGWAVCGAHMPGMMESIQVGRTTSSTGPRRCVRRSAN
jgi:predicted unusual protein kinase regulating ubiquinone biosynthesis (AarF/ABC1/UbiB family)